MNTLFQQMKTDFETIKGVRKSMECVFILFMLVAFLVSCDKEKTPMMDRAESMMDTYPDSALKLMESVKVDSLPTAETRARYSILMAMARDKNDLKVENDSALRKALGFYKQKGNRMRESQAHFYLAAYYRGMDKRALQYACLDSALHIIPNEESRFGGIIHATIANLFLRTGLYEEAIEELQKELEIVKNTGDADLYAITECYIGYGLFSQNSDSAIQYMRKGYELLEELPESGNKGRHFSQSCYNLGMYYNEIAKYDSVEFFGRKGLETAVSLLDSIHAFLTLACAMSATGRLDSATIMFQKMTDSPHAIHKRQAYLALSEIERARGNASKALEYERLGVEFYSTEISQGQKVDVLNMVQKCKIDREQYQKRQGRKRMAFIISGLVVLLLLLAIYYWRHVRQHREVLQSTQQHLEESKSEAEKQNQKMQEMQEQIDRIDAQVGELNELERKKSILIMERRMMVQEKLEEVEAYQKLLRMVNEAEKFNEVHTRMEEMDWTQLMRYVDSQMDNICLRLFSEKGMKQDDVNFCILLLLNFSHINMANIMNCTRSAIYKRERYILQHRFGITDKDKRLKDVLMEMAQGNNEE